LPAAGLMAVGLEGAAQVVTHRRKAFRAGAAPCTTLRESQTTASATVSCFNGSSTTFVGSQWTTAATYTLCRLTTRIYRVGTPTGTITAYIYTNNLGEPGTLLATSTTTISAGALTDSTAGEDAGFTFAGLSLTSGTAYYMVLGSSAVSGANFVRWVAGATSTGNTDSSADATTWASVGTRQLGFQAFSQ
jgi:hypothetical protein